MRQIRQGDVLLVRVEAPTGELVDVAREYGRVVLAHGEVTGHAHAIVDEAAQLVTAAEALDLYLIVHGEQPVSLVHEEHETLSVDPGAYRVVRQREYTPSPVDERDWDWVHD
jgi:hypothetical protein